MCSVGRDICIDFSNFRHHAKLSGAQADQHFIGAEFSIGASLKGQGALEKAPTRYLDADALHRQPAPHADVHLRAVLLARDRGPAPAALGKAASMGELRHIVMMPFCMQNTPPPMPKDR